MVFLSERRAALALLFSMIAQEYYKKQDTARSLAYSLEALAATVGERKVEDWVGWVEAMSCFRIADIYSTLGDNGKADEYLQRLNDSLNKGAPMLIGLNVTQVLAELKQEFGAAKMGPLVQKLKDPKNDPEVVQSAKWFH